MEWCPACRELNILTQKGICSDCEIKVEQTNMLKSMGFENIEKAKSGLMNYDKTPEAYRGGADYPKKIITFYFVKKILESKDLIELNKVQIEFNDFVKKHEKKEEVVETQPTEKPFKKFLKKIKFL